jgi:hypothetical protein
VVDQMMVLCSYSIKEMSMTYARGKWPRPTIEQSFWERANKAEGCWLWSGSLNDDGYGILRRLSAHRYAYELLVGPIPDGMEIDHVCSVRKCVNPAHMEAVTHTENIRRSWVRGNCENRRNTLAEMHKSKTHCPHGHALSGENLVFDTQSGARRCRICNNNKAARYKQRKKETRIANG